MRLSGAARRGIRRERRGAASTIYSVTTVSLHGPRASAAPWTMVTGTSITGTP